MNEGIQQVTEVAKGISDYGMMAVTAAFFLLLSAVMMVAIFKLFKSMINRLLKQQACLRQLLDTVQDIANSQRNIEEYLQPGTLLQIRNLTGFAFDLGIEQVCRLIKRIREENYISDRATTSAKIRKSIQVIHDDRNSRFDAFTYHGKQLSEYCSPKWVDSVVAVVENEIYSKGGENSERAYTNVKLAYDNIKTDFYHMLNS